MKLSLVLVAAVLAAGMLASGGWAQDQEPTKEDVAKAEARGAVVGELALANELAVFGRDTKSPESPAA